jgi:hypothetical protein
MTTNEKRLLEVRAELLTADPAERVGSEWEAHVHSREQERLDGKGVIARFGTDLLKPFLKTIRWKAFI